MKKLNKKTRKVVVGILIAVGSFVAGIVSVKNPEAGDVIEGTGGLRKVRFVDERLNKGKRGGLRVIYYWWSGGTQFWLFTLYGKHEQNDLTPQHKKALKHMLDREIKARMHDET